MDTKRAEIQVITNGATKEQFMEDIQSMNLYSSYGRVYQAGNFEMLEDIEDEVDEKDYKEFFVDSTGLSNLDSEMPFATGKVTVRNHSYELNIWLIED